MSAPAPTPQVAVRGEARLVVDTTVSGPHWRPRPPGQPGGGAGPARRGRRRRPPGPAYATAVGARLTARLEISDVGLPTARPRVAAPVAAMARFAAEELRLDLAPAPQEVLGSVEVRFAMSQPDQEVFGG